MSALTIEGLHELNKLLIRRKNRVIFSPIDTDYVQCDEEKAMVVAMLKNIQALGYTLHPHLMEKVIHSTRSELEQFYTNLMPELKSLVGADVEYKPMYPNFPSQVAEMSDTELYFNAIIHYLSDGELLPNYETNERLPLITTEESSHFNVIDAGYLNDVFTLFTNLCSSKTSLSVQDKEDIALIINNCSNYVDYLPIELPFKENMVHIVKSIMSNSPYECVDDISRYFHTPTDVLRLITALSDGDISLSENTRYRSLKRKERRMIMDLLAKVCHKGIQSLEDMYKYKGKWLRVGEKLHPGEYTQPKYEDVLRNFSILRNQKKPLMFNGKVQQFINEGQFYKAAQLLQQNPGEFARHLDKLVRDTATPITIVEMFREVADLVSTPVLLQVMKHFATRRAEECQHPIRVFFPKGNIGKVHYIPQDLPPIACDICDAIVDICKGALSKEYSKRSSMGKVYINPELCNYIVPFSQRSASATSKCLVRGSRIKVKPDTKAIRSFIWWTNADFNNRVDIDLSAAIYDENWNYVEHVSYTQLRSTKYKAYHSGDIVDGGPPCGEGVAEFIDIDIDGVNDGVGRYVVFQVYSFTTQEFSTLPNCRFGWMERKGVNDGGIFEPSTVEMNMNLTTNSTTAIPVIFDCLTKEFVWCDMSLGISCLTNEANNLECNFNKTTATCYAMTHINKPTLMDLIGFNAGARGTITDNRNEADIIFDINTEKPKKAVLVDKVIDGVKTVTAEVIENDVPIITPYDIDYFVGELL